MKEIRRENLRNLLISPRFNGDREKFCQDAEITKGRLSQLLDDSQPFGDVSARNLCEKLGLAENYFSRQDVAEPVNEGEFMELSNGALEIAALYDLIPQSDLIRRAQAYSAATTEIVRVIEGHKQQQTEQQPADQKTQSA